MNSLATLVPRLQLGGKWAHVRIDDHGIACLGRRGQMGLAIDGFKESSNDGKNAVRYIVGGLWLSVDKLLEVIDIDSFTYEYPALSKTKEY